MYVTHGRNIYLHVSYLPLFKRSNTWLSETAKNATMLVQHNWDWQRQRIAPFLLHCTVRLIIYSSFAIIFVKLARTEQKMAL